MHVQRKPENPPDVRSLFEAVDAATRPTFSGKIVIEVEAGKAKQLTTVKEADHPNPR